MQCAHVNIFSKDVHLIFRPWDVFVHYQPLLFEFAQEHLHINMPGPPANAPANKSIRLGFGFHEDDAKGVIDESFVEEKVIPLFMNYIT